MKIIADFKQQYLQGGITAKLIIWNVALFLISIPFFYNFRLAVFNLPNWIALSSDPQIFVSRPWTLLTYAFFHHGFGHLLFNMIILNFSCQLFLTFFNSKQLLALYLLSSFFSGISFIIVYYVLQLNSLIVGASAAIMAILVATATYRPSMNVQLLFFGNVKLWHVTAIILTLDTIQFRFENTGGHIAHLSGAIFGFIFIKLIENEIDLSKIVTNPSDNKPNLRLKKVYKNSQKDIRKSKIVIKSKEQQQIDDILDKISQSGYDCLTEDEKSFLFKAGK